MNLDFALFIPVLILSVVVHEVAHAWQARREGDPTAERLGRITLNPLPHLDLIGSVVVPLLLFVGTDGLIFGWAKPVPVNPANFRDHPGGDIRVSLAGIVSNLVLAVLFTLLAGILVPAQAVLGSTVAGILQQAAFFGIFINLLLAFFNLLPIPPLDGSHVVAQLLPRELAARYRAMGRFGIPVLLLLIFFLPGALGVALAPVTWLMGWADAFVRMWL
ncbi:MAG: site-2 protease family protein [Gemmatimonadales bacterium]|jgi:Zn-dependent protease|nr:MAG: site-2 protease family protein [Gemmatimonadales bacterium]